MNTIHILRREHNDGSFKLYDHDSNSIKNNQPLMKRSLPMVFSSTKPSNLHNMSNTVGEDIIKQLHGFSKYAKEFLKKEKMRIT